MSSRRFDRWDLGAEALARALLGQILVRVDRGRRRSGRIVETEAYLGSEDLGSHTAGDRRTPRNKSMFLPGGRAYVYFVYGMHHCLNVVAAPEGVGCAVLIRAIEPLEGIRQMEALRGLKARAGRSPGTTLDSPRSAAALRAIASGPARLCQALGVDRRFDGEDLRVSSRLFIERDTAIRRTKVLRSPRVGIPYAGSWRLAPLRFSITDHPSVSLPNPVKARQSPDSGAHSSRRLQRVDDDFIMREGYS